jgi:uncharacterized SAM-binding protein YcdF (DUF218 family)
LSEHQNSITLLLFRSYRFHNSRVRTAVLEFTHLFILLILLIVGRLHDLLESVDLLGSPGHLFRAAFFVTLPVLRPDFVGDREFTAILEERLIFVYRVPEAEFLYFLFFDKFSLS